MKNPIKKVVTIAAATVISAFAVNTAVAGGDLVRGYPAVWEGAYLGAHLGGAFGEIDLSAARLGRGQADVDGIVGGVHLGYNIQRGNLVFGIEGDISATGADVDGTDVEMDYLASIRGRIGYAMNNTLLYATGGFAWTELSVPGDSETLSGYVLGGGVEHKFNPKWSLRGEVLHYNFDETFSGVDYEIDTTVVRAGVSYHFN